MLHTSTPVTLEAGRADVHYRPAQALAPAAATAPTRPIARPDGQRPRVRATPTLAIDQLTVDQLTDDYERAWYCRSRAETYRDRWFSGRGRAVAYVVQRAQAGDLRFARMTTHELEVTGRTRWSQSLQARKLAGLEQRYTAWARMYLAFAQVQLLAEHGRGR